MQAETTVLSKPEVFWVAIQAGLTAVTFVVVFFYTLYTRRMMRLQELSRRSEIRPVFSVRDQLLKRELMKDPSGSYQTQYGVFSERFQIIIGVRNIGKGPAVLLRAWHQPVSDSFEIGQTTIFKQSPQSGFASIHSVSENLEELGDGLFTALMELLPHEAAQLYIRKFDPNLRWLFVFECSDIVNGSHQLQILREAGKDSPFTTWKMAHAMGDTFGEGIVTAFRRFVEIRLWIEKYLSQLED